MEMVIILIYVLENAPFCTTKRIYFGLASIREISS